MNRFHADTFGGGERPERRGRKPSWKGPCRTKGCPETKTYGRGRCRRCYSRLYTDFGGPFWPEDVGLEWGKKCCFKTCNELGQGEFADGDFPLCKYHELTIWMMTMLEEISYEEPLSTLPINNDWLWARYIAELREYTLSKGGDTTPYKHAIGDTPLFRIFMECNKFYLPLLHSLGV